MDVTNSLSLDAKDNLMNWYTFDLPRDEYKSGRKILNLEDVTSREQLQIFANIHETESTDLQITFYSERIIVNDTGQHLAIIKQDANKEYRAIAC